MSFYHRRREHESCGVYIPPPPRRRSTTGSHKKLVKNSRGKRVWKTVRHCLQPEGMGDPRSKPTVVKGRALNPGERGRQGRRYIKDSALHQQRQAEAVNQTRQTHLGPCLKARYGRQGLVLYEAAGGVHYWVTEMNERQQRALATQYEYELIPGIPPSFND